MINDSCCIFHCTQHKLCSIMTGIVYGQRRLEVLQYMVGFLRLGHIYKCKECDANRALPDESRPLTLLIACKQRACACMSPTPKPAASQHHVYTCHAH